MTEKNEYVELTDYLKTLGHSAYEIDLILARVRQYEVETQHDSIMDSIGNGRLNLTAIINEALGKVD